MLEYSVESCKTNIVFANDIPYNPKREELLKVRISSRRNVLCGTWNETSEFILQQFHFVDSLSHTENSRLILARFPRIIYILQYCARDIVYPRRLKRRIEVHKDEP